MKTKTIAAAAIISMAIPLFFTGCTKDVAPGATTNRQATEKGTASVFNDNFIVDVTDNIWLPCANGGNGENVYLSGPLHVLITGTFTNNTGRVHYQFQSQGIKGVGSITGDTYNITSLDEETITGSFINGRFLNTFIENFRIIGPGAGNNYSAHGTFHYTYNANGQETASFDNFTADCK